jgi:hypothetical protein
MSLLAFEQNYRLSIDMVLICKALGGIGFDLTHTGVFKALKKEYRDVERFHFEYTRFLKKRNIESWEGRPDKHPFSLLVVFLRKHIKLDGGRGKFYFLLGDILDKINSTKSTSGVTKSESPDFQTPMVTASAVQPEATTKVVPRSSDSIAETLLITPMLQDHNIRVFFDGGRIFVFLASSAWSFDHISTLGINETTVSGSLPSQEELSLLSLLINIEPRKETVRQISCVFSTTI